MSDDLCQRLRLVRVHFGLTGTEMAERAGLRDRKTWGRYEAGDTRPNTDTLAVLYDMGVDTNWLLSGEGEMLRGSESPLKWSPAVDETEVRKDIYNVAYWLASKSPAIKADPVAFAEAFLAVYDFLHEKQATSEGLDDRSFQNVVDFAARRLRSGG